MGDYEKIIDDRDGGYYDYNPAHAIWYIFTNYFKWNEDILDSASFLAAAKTLFDEKLGISCYFMEAVEIKTILREILTHIRGVLRWGADGKLYLFLIRKDYTKSSLPEINTSHLQSEPTIDRPSWADTFSEVKIQFHSREVPPAARAIRLTQEVVEVLRTPIPQVRLTQEAVEVVRTPIPEGRITQEVVEVVRNPVPQARVTQEVIEVARGYIYGVVDDIYLGWTIGGTQSSTTTTTS